MTTRVAPELIDLLGEEAVLSEPPAIYGHDATEHEGLEGKPDLVVVPRDTEQVRAAVKWCYANDVPIVPRGGGSGFSGGAVPVRGGVVISLERMTRVRSFDPGLWRMEVEAGLRTADVRRLARENGLFYPVDPGAAEQSHIGGNIATNAGGPHAFKYGVTGHWVTGLEAVVPPGEIVSVGGPVRKDVAGYDLRGLLIGSEGTLGIVTAAWLRLIPAPEAALPVVAAYPGIAEGCAAIEAVLASGVLPAAVEYLDENAVAASRGAFPEQLPSDARFVVIAEADGSAEEAARVAGELREAMADGAVLVHEPSVRGDVEALWRWRDGVSIAVAAVRGGKMSEDIAVPLDRLRDAIQGTLDIAGRHGLDACSWGHAGDGNLHSTFMIDSRNDDEVRRAHDAVSELFELAAELGGTISGEHGMGWVKRGRLGLQWSDRAVELHREIKRMFDPKGLMNPGKKE
ncbi:MAG TPA: FAD-linked oxidase C-terminal domain-containing protein [Thermoleophilaceae bacterium]